MQGNLCTNISSSKGGLGMMYYDSCGRTNEGLLQKITLYIVEDSSSSLASRITFIGQSNSSVACQRRAFFHSVLGTSKSSGAVRNMPLQLASRPQITAQPLGPFHPSVPLLLSFILPSQPLRPVTKNMPESLHRVRDFCNPALPHASNQTIPWSKNAYSMLAQGSLW